MKYLTLENPDNTYVIDIETESLTPSVIWCCIILCVGTRQVWKFINDGTDSIYKQLKEFINERPDAVYIGHNAISFDAVYVARLTGTTIPLPRVIDTLVLSYLHNPSLDGGHSLESYGQRLKFPKGDYSDWSHYTPEMLAYCEQDVYLTEKVYFALQKRMNKIGFSELSCKIEHDIRVIINKQQENGFYFNVSRAYHLQSILEQRLSNLSKTIFKLFPPKLETVGTYTRRVRKDGSDYASYERHLRDYTLKDNGDGTYDTLELRSFNIGSPKQRLERLLELGFEPTAKTKKGNPKLDEDSLVAFANQSGRPEVQAMADWLVVRGRLNMLAGNPETGGKGWLDYVGPDSRIHGKVFTCGASSRRMTHNSPNLANIPSAANGAQYGDECRALFGVTPDKNRRLVGYDAKGLETHVLCHVLNDPRASEMLLDGDVHQVNSDTLTEKLGFPVVRGGGGAKTLLYAAIFGSYPPKLGSIVKKDALVGKKIQKIIYDTVPGLGKAVKRVQAEWRQNDGLIRTIDGGYVRCPSEHAALNYNIQPNGGILMKLTSIFLDKRLFEKGIWHFKVVDCHDESQHETDEKDAEELGKIAVQCITDAGEELGFRVRMSGSYKIGLNWSECH